MKKLELVIILFAVGLLFTSCQKEETIENYDSISGVLMAGENITSADLEGIKIYLGRFHDSIDFSSITFNTAAIDSVGTTVINADGSFAFTGLAPGNYGIALEEGYIFSFDTALMIQLDGKTIPQIIKSVETCIPENADPGSFYISVCFKKGSLSDVYQLKRYRVSIDDDNNKPFSGECNFPILTEEMVFEKVGAIFDYIEFETWIYDQSGMKTGVSTSGWLPLRSSEYKTEIQTYHAGPIDITWVPNNEEGFWLWKTGHNGYYLFSDHQ